MAEQLWGLCRRRLVRDAAAFALVAWRAVAPVADDDDRLRDAVVLCAAVRSVPEVATRAMTTADGRRRSGPTGVRNARNDIWSEGASMGAGHDVSFQKDERDGGDRHGLGTPRSAPGRA